MKKRIRIFINIATLLLIINTTAIAKKHKFKDDNYSIKLDKSWVLKKDVSSMIGQFFYSDKLKKGLIIRKLPLMLFKDSKFPTNKQEYIDFIRNNYLNGQIEKISTLMENYFTIVSVKLAGFDGFLVNIKSDDGKSKKKIGITSFGTAIVKQNGNYYLFTLIKATAEDIYKREFQNILSDFKILDPNKTNKNTATKFKPTNKMYKSYYYGYQIPYFENMLKASTLDLGFKEEDESTLNSLFIDTKQSLVFAISSYCSDNVVISDKKLLSYYINDFENTLKPFTIKQTKKDGLYATGKIFDDDLKSITYYFKAITFDKCQHIIMYYNAIDKGLSPLTEFTSYFEKIPVNHSLLSREFVNKQNLLHAMTMSSMANRVYTDDAETAYKLFKQSLMLNPNNALNLDSYFSVANELKKYSEALDILNNVDKKITQEPKFISWKAWLLAQTENVSLAIELYEQLFSQEYTNDEDFFAYIGLLESKSRWNQIITSIDNNIKNVSKKKSLYLKRALAYVKTNQNNKAKEILNFVINSKDFQDYNIYDILDVYFEIKEFSIGIQLIQNYMEKNDPDANIYFYLGDFQYNNEQPKLALESMNKALKYQPNNDTILSYISGINNMMGIGDIEITKTIINPVKLPKLIVEDIKNLHLSNKKDPIENYYYITGYDFKKGDFSTKTIRRKLLINDLQSVKDIKTIQISFNQEFEHPYINEFIVTNKTSGKKTSLDRSTVYITSDNDGIYADGDKYLNIPVPSIDDNTEIEYVISIQSHSPVDTFNLETNYFISSKSYEYMADFIQGDIEDIQANYTDSIIEKSFKNLKIWKSHNIDKFKNESYIPEYHKQFEWVEIATAEKNWKTLGNDYLKRIEGKLNSKISKGQLLSILPDSKDPITIVKELSQYVQSGITYQALEFGSRAQIPNKTKQTLMNKYGDCKDHAVVLYDLLTLKGIKAQLALVNTGKYVNHNLVTLDQFDHVVIYLPNINGGIFIDTTDKFTNIDLKLPPRSIQGSDALILEKNNSKLISIPKISSNQNVIDIERSISQNEKHNISKETAIITGYIASDIRAYLQPLKKDDLNTEILKWVSSFYPDLGLLEFNYYNLNNLNKPLVVEFTFVQNKKISDFKVHPFLERVFLSYSGIENRKYPFEFTEAFEIHSATTTKDKNFLLPKISQSYQSPTINWSLNTKSEDNQQNFDAYIYSGLFAADKYSPFTETTKTALFKIEKSVIVK